MERKRGGEGMRKEGREGLRDMRGKGEIRGEEREGERKEGV